MLGVMSRVLAGRLLRLALGTLAAVIALGLVELLEGSSGTDL